MSDEQDRELEWMEQHLNAANRFASTIKELHEGNPYNGAVSLLQIAVAELMCALWEEGFSQSEIREACERAVVVMLRFSNGEEA